MKRYETNIDVLRFGNGWEFQVIYNDKMIYLRSQLVDDSGRRAMETCNKGDFEELFGFGLPKVICKLHRRQFKIIDGRFCLTIDLDFDGNQLFEVKYIYLDGRGSRKTGFFFPSTTDSKAKWLKLIENQDLTTIISICRRDLIDKIVAEVPDF